MKNITPVFIFSLPRSGSTLLQRLISMHSEVATESETWLLLPLFYIAKSETSFTEYSGSLATIGIHEALAKIENGKDKYKQGAAKLAASIYAELAKNGEKYFLEKTPRNHLVVQEILESFPDAKFIFLWRNPLAVAGSILSSWGKGRWYMYRFYVDLFKGLENLVSAYEQNKSRSLALNYESLLAEPGKELKRIMEYLELPEEEIDPGKLKQFQLSGTMGDDTGTKAYMNLSNEPLQKWKAQIRNPVRRSWCRKYLQWAGERRLSTMGYDKTELENQLNSIRMSPLLVLSDIVRMTYGFIYRLFDLQLLWMKFRKIFRKERIYPYT